MGEFINIDTIVSDRPLAPRVHNPLDPFCPLHLRRICGVCAHFEGALKTGPARARCAAFDREKHRLASAARCPRWERKGARNG